MMGVFEVIKKFEKAKTRKELHELSLELKQAIENREELIKFLSSRCIAKIIIEKINDSFYVDGEYTYSSFDITITVTTQKLKIFIENKYNTIEYKGKWKTALSLKNAFDVVQKYNAKLLDEFYRTRRA